MREREREKKFENGKKKRKSGSEEKGTAHGPLQSRTLINHTVFPLTILPSYLTFIYEYVPDRFLAG